ncbi:MAG: cytochrome c [Vicinamibacterales bacterium]
MKSAMVALMLAASIAAVASAQEKTQGKKSIWAGVYTDAQADRGVMLYKSKCVMCHGPALGGAIDGGPPLRGLEFFVRWDGTPLNEMVNQVSELMPAEYPGTLKRQEYVDIITFFLRANGVPAGATELSADDAALSAVEFTEKK